MQYTEMIRRFHFRSAIPNRVCPAHSARRPSPGFPGLYSAATCVLLALLVNIPSRGISATRSAKQMVVPAWSRCERVLLSNCEYTNPLQEINLTAVFTSPNGQRRIVNGFWDGGRVWRVRFSPIVAGQWTFTTVCSDPRNTGLDGQT